MLIIYGITLLRNSRHPFMLNPRRAVNNLWKYFLYCAILNFMPEYVARPGKALPFGATPSVDGVNFSVFSRNASSVTLALFNNEADAEPSFTFELSQAINRTGDVWHIFVEGLAKGALYLYAVDGPFEPEKGHRFNKNLYLFDPYAKALTNASVFSARKRGGRGNASVPHDAKPSAAGMPKCVVVCDGDFDWQGDKPLNYPLRRSILYEAHVKGFTQSPTSGTMQPGTYRGFIEKIPYLKNLGVTSVEFLPLHEFDEYENKNVNPHTGEPLKNFWGYSTVAFFAPKASYAADKSPGACVNEFKELVREMHKNGLEVILDVVFNHTAEGNETGETLNFRGFENSVYYLLEENDKRLYKNFSGCGNAVNCNHPVVRAYIIDCLHYWVGEMHVDGFRFDLASVLARDTKGHLSESAPLLEQIAEDPLLSGTKIIAEAWDAAGGYQVGNFGGRWAEWNDRFRDDIRRFWRGDTAFAGGTATRVAGSSDLYLHGGRKPFHSINYLTSHDGFTLNDLVSYDKKHNEINGEDNKDGSDVNFSCNCGHEGPSDDKDINLVRNRRIKNMILTLLLSQGTPMLLAGDEFRRSQKGNNNAYCQDNEISWINWSLKDTHADIFEFTRKTIAFRLRHAAFRRGEFFLGRDISDNDVPDISWFDENGVAFNWENRGGFLACRIDGSGIEIQSESDDNDFYLMYNAGAGFITAKIPPSAPGKKWYRCIDTSLPSPGDFLDEKDAIGFTTPEYPVPGGTAVVLIGK